MPDPKKLLEAQMAEHLAKAREIERDLQEYQRITEKYGLDSSKPSEQSVKAKPLKESTAARARREAEDYVFTRGQPVALTPLYEELVKRGVEIGGKTPRSTLSAYLGQGGNLKSTPEGWWFKDRPIPKKPRKSFFAGGGNETPDSELSGVSKTNGALPLIAN